MSSIDFDAFNYAGVATRVSARALINNGSRGSGVSGRGRGRGGRRILLASNPQRPSSSSVGGDTHALLSESSSSVVCLDADDDEERSRSARLFSQAEITDSPPTEEPASSRKAPRKPRAPRAKKTPVAPPVVDLLLDDTNFIAEEEPNNNNNNSTGSHDFDLLSWLSRHHLESYYNNFVARHRVTRETCAALTGHAFASLGVVLSVDKKKLKGAVKELNAMSTMREARSSPLPPVVAVAADAGGNGTHVEAIAPHQQRPAFTSNTNNNNISINNNINPCTQGRIFNDFEMDLDFDLVTDEQQHDNNENNTSSIVNRASSSGLWHISRGTVGGAAAPVAVSTPNRQVTTDETTPSGTAAYQRALGDVLSQFEARRLQAEETLMASLRKACEQYDAVMVSLADERRTSVQALRVAYDCGANETDEITRRLISPFPALELKIEKREREVVRCVEAEDIQVQPQPRQHPREPPQPAQPTAPPISTAGSELPLFPAESNLELVRGDAPDEAPQESVGPRAVCDFPNTLTPPHAMTTGYDFDVATNDDVVGPSRASSKAAIPKRNKDGDESDATIAWAHRTSSSSSSSSEVELFEDTLNLGCVAATGEEEAFPDVVEMISTPPRQKHKQFTLGGHDDPPNCSPFSSGHRPRPPTPPKSRPASQAHGSATSVRSPALVSTLDVLGMLAGPGESKDRALDDYPTRSPSQVALDSRRRTPQKRSRSPYQHQNTVENNDNENDDYFFDMYGASQFVAEAAGTTDEGLFPSAPGSPVVDWGENGDNNTFHHQDESGVPDWWQGDDEIDRTQPPHDPNQDSNGTASPAFVAARETCRRYGIRVDADDGIVVLQHRLRRLRERSLELKALMHAHQQNQQRQANSNDNVPSSAGVPQSERDLYRLTNELFRASISVGADEAFGVDDDDADGNDDDNADPAKLVLAERMLLMEAVPATEVQTTLQMLAKTALLESDCGNDDDDDGGGAVLLSQAAVNVSDRAKQLKYLSKAPMSFIQRWMRQHGIVVKPAQHSSSNHSISNNNNNAREGGASQHQRSRGGAYRGRGGWAGRGRGRGGAR
eukprot:PhM_4_TR17497/c0_g1_i1/m.44175